MSIDIESCTTEDLIFELERRGAQQIDIDSESAYQIRTSVGEPELGNGPCTILVVE